ncbi:unnamed protein product, partial [marine sediment metagenome]
MDRPEDIKEKIDTAIRRGPISEGAILDMEREYSSALETALQEAREKIDKLRKAYQGSMNARVVAENDQVTLREERDAARSVLRRVDGKFRPTTRWPCPDCGRVGPGELLR